MQHRDEPISFYIPVRNAAGTLQACIEAVRAQTRPPDEFFVVVDPASADATLEVARSCNVRILEQEGASLGAARNTAVRAAAYRWLACCDSDVLIAPDWLERLAALRKEGAAGIGGRTLERVRNPCDAWRGLHMPHHWGRFPLHNTYMLVSEVLFDREALLAVGGYRDDLSYYEDSDLCQRLRDAGWALRYEPGAVGHHQRTDTLESLLTLRWKYSEYRQRYLLDTFSGLARKLAVNREYALTTLARSLARGCPELGYASVLLFFHHAVMDLQALLSRRPLLSDAQRHVCLDALRERLVGEAGQRLPGLASPLSGDVPPPSMACGPDRDPLLLPRVWSDYLDHVAAATRALCDQVAEISSTLIDSARAFHDSERTACCRFVPPGAEQLRERLSTLPLTPAIDDSFCDWLSQQGIGRVCTLGPVLPAESAALEQWKHRGGSAGAERVAIAPHLEARVDPPKVFGEIDVGVSRAVVCYRPPPEFLAGLDVPAASDLAQAAAAAGWRIEQFETLVGRTRLLLRRTKARVETHSPRG